MNKKIVLNWLRSLLNLKQICEIDGCTAKADRKLATKRSPWHPGDWIVKPYSPYLIQVLRKAIDRGRLVKR